MRETGKPSDDSVYIENLKKLLSEAYANRKIVHELDEDGNIRVTFTIPKEALRIELSSAPISI